MRVQHRVSRLTTYRVLFYTYIYIIESFLPLVQPLIVIQKYNIPWVREKRKRAKEKVIIYIRKPTGHSFL